MDDHIKAIILMLFAQFSFSIMDLFVRVAVRKIGILETVFFRGLFTMIMVLIIVSFNRVSITGKKKKLLILRGVFGFLGLFCYVFGINYLKLANAVLLNRSSPIFVVIFSAILLKEKITKKQIISLILAFIGVVNIIKPGGNVNLFAGIIGLLSALFSGIAYIIVKKLSFYNSPYTIVFYFTLVTTLMTGPLLPLNFTIPTKNLLIVLVIMGVSSTLAQVLMTYSYKKGDAGKVSIVSYTSVLFSALWGFIFFKEVEDLQSIIGGILIILSCILLSQKNKREVIDIEDRNNL